MDADDDLRNSEIDIKTYQEISQNRPTVPNLNKLTHNEIFYQKDDVLHIKELVTPVNSYDLKKFQTAKDRYEKGIAKFKQNNNVEESNLIGIGRYRKRTKSIDTEVQGAYYLYNWINVEEYPCEKPPPEDKSAHVIYQILANNWNKALHIASQLPKCLEVQTLEFVLKGFKIIDQLIYEENQYFQEHFIGRARFPIMYKASSDTIGGPSPMLNVFQEEARHAFRELRALPKKVECLRMNLQYMVKFASKYKVSKGDDYMTLAFKILGNFVDQNQLHPYPDKQYSKILAHLNIKINDRLNYASKLLPEKKRKIFCAQLDNNLTRFPQLDNILYYLPATNKVREKKIEQIARNYLDQSSDLETVAYLSVEYPFLRGYYQIYQQLLYLSDSQKQLERLQTIRFEAEGEERDTGEVSRSIKMTNFFDFININEQRVMEVRMIKENFGVCQICSKKIQKSETFLECGKCRHGGHASHLLKWFQQSENCPHIGCPCICN